MGALAMEPEDLTLPSGEQVTVRGLTGMEVALIGKHNAQDHDPDSAGGIAMQIGFGVLNKTTVRDAETAGIGWLVSHGAADFNAVIDRLNALSGFGKGAAKSDVRPAGDGP